MEIYSLEALKLSDQVSNVADGPLISFLNEILNNRIHSLLIWIPGLYK